MKIRKVLVGLGMVAFVLALGALFIAYDIYSAQSEIAAWSTRKYPAERMPADLPIEVVGRDFEWRIRYASRRRFQGDPQIVENFGRECNNGQTQADDVHVVNELHLWRDAAVRIHLKAADVPHKLFIPTGRILQSASPGSVTEVWFQFIDRNVAWDAEAADWKLTEPWDMACAEHSQKESMRGMVWVHDTKEDFLRWLRHAEEMRLPPPKEK